MDIGFIGCGKMARAMIGGMIRSGKVKPEEITASARTEKTLNQAEEDFNINISFDNKEVARKADLLFLAVSPADHGQVIEEIKHDTDAETVVITIAAGLTAGQIGNYFGRPVKVVRSMPNTPSLAGAGMSALCANEAVSESEFGHVIELFRSFGETEIITEDQMDAIPSISGSSPAYVYMMIEAMADGGVRQGLGRDQAYRLAAQAVLGAAEMVLKTGEHPGVLKDQVCSPGGSTIAAVSTLEESQFRGAILNAMATCTEKVKELGREKESV